MEKTKKKKKTQGLYCVLALHESNLVQLGLSQVEMAMSWADGMVGALPVFKDLESAREYANGNRQIMELEFEQKVIS